MFSRQAIWPMLASAASLLVTALVSAQVPKTPPPPPTAGSVPIIPVSLSNEQVAATINGEKILVGEVRKLLDTKPCPLSLTELQKKEMRGAALEALIEDVLMRQYLAKNCAPIGKAEFNKEATEFQDALKKQNKTIESFLKETGQTQEQLSRDIVARLQWKTLLRLYLPDAKAKVYYDANKPFFDKVQVRASHILLQLPPNATKEQRDKATQQLLVWRQDIVTGKIKFEDAAKQYSHCTSKSKGGDVGPFRSKFDVVPEFSAAAFSLKVGEISPVVQTVFGAHLIMVTERTPGEASNFETVKDFVREVWEEDEKLSSRILADHRKKSDVRVSLP